MGSFWKGLARAFTVPRAVRAKLNANPITAVAKAALKQELGNVIVSTVGKNVSDPAAASAISEALGHVIGKTGIFD